jgi:G3E family GTPase
MVTATAANSVEQIYDVILGTGCIVFSILALVQLLMATINKFVEYYSRQIDRIVMDESFDESDDDDDSSESDYSEYSENESSDSEYSDDDDDGNGNCSKCHHHHHHHHHHHDDIELTLTPYIPPRRSQRLLENRAKCNSPLLIRRLKFD